MITIKVNKSKCHGKFGPYLDKHKVKSLPKQFGPDRLNRVVRSSVQKIVDVAIDQKEVFGLLRQGDGNVVITASYEDKLQKVKLPTMETEDQVWDFMEILFEELRCEQFYERPRSGSSSSSDEDDEDDEENLPLKDSRKRPPDVRLTFSSSTPKSARLDHHHNNSTPPNLTSEVPVSPSSGSSKMSRLSSHSSTSSSTTPSVSMDAASFYNGGVPKLKIKTGAGGTTSTVTSHSYNHHSTTSRPRGRPPGAKNKIPPEAKAKLKSSPNNHKSSAASSSSTAPAVHRSQSLPHSSPNKKPIYHDAHKSYLAQQQAKQHHHHHQNSASPSTSTGAPTRTRPIVGQPQQQQQEQQPLPIDPTLWSIDHVINYISDLDPTLQPHVEMFRQHEIDGNALLLLTESAMMKYMDMKLGPALKIVNIINKIQGKPHQMIPTYDY